MAPQVGGLADRITASVRAHPDGVCRTLVGWRWLVGREYTKEEVAAAISALCRAELLTRLPPECSGVGPRWIALIEGPASLYPDWNIP